MSMPLPVDPGGPFPGGPLSAQDARILVKWVLSQ
jgi:hypothetical protein